MIIAYFVPLCLLSIELFLLLMGAGAGERGRLFIINFPPVHITVDSRVVNT